MKLTSFTILLPAVVGIYKFADVFPQNYYNIPTIFKFPKGEYYSVIRGLMDTNGKCRHVFDLFDPTQIVSLKLTSSGMLEKRMRESLAFAPGEIDSLPNDRVGEYPELTLAAQKQFAGGQLLAEWAKILKENLPPVSGNSGTDKSGGTSEAGVRMEVLKSVRYFFAESGPHEWIDGHSGFFYIGCDPRFSGLGTSLVLLERPLFPRLAQLIKESGPLNLRSDQRDLFDNTPVPANNFFAGLLDTSDFCVPFSHALKWSTNVANKTKSNLRQMGEKYLTDLQVTDAPVTVAPEEWVKSGLVQKYASGRKFYLGCHQVGWTSRPAWNGAALEIGLLALFSSFYSTAETTPVVNHGFKVNLKDNYSGVDMEQLGY